MSSLDLIELEAPECSCKDYVQINYQSIVDFLLEPALNREITETKYHKYKFNVERFITKFSKKFKDIEYERMLVSNIL